MIATTLLLLSLPQAPVAVPQGKEPLLRFERRTLSTEFLCEGASIGDLNGDGKPDVAAGPWWYEGPEFKTRHAFYPSKQFPRLQYSDHFFSWILDLDGDGKNDVFVVCFPGEDAYWLRNTGDPDKWDKHTVFHGVDNESPAFADITGDGKPELVCQHEDQIGWLAADWSDPKKPWTFHAAFPKGAGGKFTHGLGVGDLNGDGKPDILRKDAWLGQPKSLDGDPQWQLNVMEFAKAGGAQMLVFDVDGDGDADVVTSLAAHGWGLSWYEQQPGGKFTAHEVLADKRAPGNVSELHALTTCDLDGDGLTDVVTGKRWWSHGPTRDGNQDGANDPAVLLGLLLRRDNQGARFEVVVLDSESGVGTQVNAGDLDGDGRCDVVVGNKRGTFVLLQRQAGAAARPGAVAEGPDLNFESGTLRGWTATGNAFDGQPVRGDVVKSRRKDMESGHQGDWWVGTFEMVGDPGKGTLTSDPITVSKPWASFLIGGGKGQQTRVEIVAAEDGKVLYTATGNNEEKMERMVADLSARVGKQVRVRLVDDDAAKWGHLNFDDFQFQAEPGHALIADVAAGLSPADAAKVMTVPEGFRVDLIAGEPDLHQPIALFVDQRGRLWVAEAYSYPTRRKDEEARDTILVFEDTNRDGTFDKRTVFLDHLNLVSGLAVGFGGVWIGAAPELLFVPDKNNDLVPDGKPEVVLDGFGLEDTHETLNSFTWGPDGWLYGTHGVYTHSKVGKQGTAEKDRVRINAGVWRLHPQRREFEVFAWGTSNPWGIDFDDRGEAFITACVIPHLWHITQGGRYHRQGGRHFDKYPWIEIKTIADHRHYTGDTDDHAWWGRDRAVADTGTDKAGGGHAHCGALVYKADAFGPEYRNAVLMNNIHGNRINQDRLERDGSGYVGHHAPDLVKANDPWYRGVALRQGPSGEVFFIDWYDRNACHRTKNEIWDRTNGRLYRLCRGNLSPLMRPLDQLTDAELVAMQEQHNDWYVSNARRVLQERGKIDLKAQQALQKMLRSHRDADVRLHALWTLHAVEALADEDLVGLLSHADADLRRWAVRLGMERPERSPKLCAELAKLGAQDRDAAVRLGLCSAMQRLQPAARWELATALLAHAGDGKDRNIPTVLWYGVEALAGEDAARFAALAASAGMEPVRRLMWRRLALGNAAERTALVNALQQPKANATEMLAEMAAGQREQPDLEAPPGWAQLAAGLMSGSDPAVTDRVAELGLAFGDTSLAPLFRSWLTDKSRSVEQRGSALEGLVRQHDQATARMLLDLLTDGDLRRQALTGLAAYELPEAPARILAVLGTLDPTDREVALATLCGRPASARAFLAAVSEGRASPRLLDAASLRRQLLSLGDPGIQPLLEKAWGRTIKPMASAEQEITRYKALLTDAFLATADASQGRALFARTCQACHVLYGIGGQVGPDLTGSNRADVSYLLSNIVDPSAEMAKEYQLSTLRLKDGRILTGNLVKDARGVLVLRTPAGDQTILRRDLQAGDAAIERTKVSLMPEGQLQALTNEEVRDLIAYLRSSAQVPLMASPENAGTFFNGRDLTGWNADPAVWSVENGELVGRTKAGLKNNNFAHSDLVVRDFRLVFEVKLTPDTANSGLQFRSEPAAGGEMKGYQADVGAGWWGLLYEELGRAVLAKPSAKAEKPGEWNTYEILAVGDQVQLCLNGICTVDLKDPKGPRKGVIAVQVHSGGPTEVRCRNFQLELDPLPVLSTQK